MINKLVLLTVFILHCNYVGAQIKPNKYGVKNQLTVTPFNYFLDSGIDITYKRVLNEHIAAVCSPILYRDFDPGYIRNKVNEIDLGIYFNIPKYSLPMPFGNSIGIMLVSGGGTSINYPGNDIEEYTKASPRSLVKSTNIDVNYFGTKLVFARAFNLYKGLTAEFLSELGFYRANFKVSSITYSDKYYKLKNEGSMDIPVEGELPENYASQDVFPFWATPLSTTWHTIKPGKIESKRFGYYPIIKLRIGYTF